MGEIAQQPAQRVAQLAVGIDRGLEDFLAERRSSE
jgi:hypothetical protein